MSCYDEVVDKIKRVRPYLVEEFGVRRIGLFGSVARQDDGRESDVDIVVELSRPLGFRFVELSEFIEGLLGKRVDLLTIEGVKNIRVKAVASQIEEEIIYV